jgi:hypothetical protein
MVFASALMKPTFSRGGDSSAGSLLVYGFLSDLFLNNDGSLQSLVFQSINVAIADMATARLLWPEDATYAVPPKHRNNERVVIEGQNIALISYKQLQIPATNDDPRKLEHAVEGQRATAARGAPCKPP